MVRVMGIMAVMATSFKRTYAGAVYSVPLNPWQATIDPRTCRRLLDTHRQVWTKGHMPGLLYSVPLNPWQATVDPHPCRRLLDTHRQVWTKGHTPGLLYSVPLNPWQATVDPRPCRRLLDTHRQVWFSLLWGHCSFLLGPGVHKVLFVPSKGLFPQSCGICVIKSHWPPKSNSLGVLSPLARSLGWEICCGSTNFLSSVRTSLV